MDHPLPAPEDDLGHYLSAMVAHAASDLFLSSGTVAAIKVQGMVRRLQEAPLSAERIKRLAYSVMRESQICDFESSMECDLASAIEGLGRFRLNAFRQRGDVGGWCGTSTRASRRWRA